MLSISKHADLHLGARNMRKFHGTTETLIFLGIIILQTNLELNSFKKLSFLLLRVRDDLGNSFPQNITLKLAAEYRICKAICR